MESQIKQIQAYLQSPINAVVIPHINPDGDALGSCLAWAQYLKLKGHAAQVVAPNEFPGFYNWMPQAADITLFSSSPERAKELMAKADVIFFLDYNDLRRIGDLKDVVPECNAKFVMIDHHREPTDFADVMISNPEKSSTSEMVYDVIEALGDKMLITKNIADCLYTGIVTDTGSFRFSSTSKNTHLAAAHLLECGVEPDQVYSKVYDNNTLSRLHLTGYALVEKLKQVGNLGASYISLSEEEQTRFDFKKGDSEGLVNYGLAISGMKVAGFFRESEGFIKVSLRSKDDFDVNTIARQHFNGGGHKNAAGGKLEMTLAEAITHFETIMNQYADALKMD